MGEPEMHMTTFVSLNVSSLSKRLEPLITWGKHIYLLQEVRASIQQQHALERRAHAMGMSITFSSPPPPSPTFQTRPGGTAIMVRHPMTLRKVHHPLLQEWDGQGRAAAAIVTWRGVKIMAASLYGFPRGHAKQHCNEVFLAQFSAGRGS